MGDHRADIKIEFSFHGVSDKADMSINYFPEGCCRMDKRVVEFFRNVYEAGIAKYENHLADIEFERTAGAREQQEREDYERLKAKFEPEARK